MRNKKFGDHVHRIDERLKTLRADKEYKAVVAADNTVLFFLNYWKPSAMYGLVWYVFSGVTQKEIIDSVCFIFDVDDDSEIKNAIAKLVRKEIKEIKEAVKEDGDEERIKKLFR